MNTVEVAGVSARYRRGGGIEDVSFAAAEGETIALFGGWGCGKTTLLQLLAGRLAVETGSIRVLGKSPRAAAHSLGYAPQKPGAPLASPFTPYQLLTHTLVRRNVPGGQRAARIAEMLQMFDLFEVRDRPARELSHGQRIGLRLASALVHRPAVVLLDDLTASLPAPIAERLHAYLDARRGREGLTVVRATTRSEEAEMADRVLLLESGRALAFDSPDSLLAEQLPDVLTVEAADPEAVQSTLRGIFDVEVLETREGFRFASADGAAVAAHLLRHPAGGVKTVYVRPPTLWDALVEQTRRQGDKETRR